MKPTTPFDLTWASIARVAIAVAAIWFAIQIRDIIALLFLVMVIVAALSPIIDRWSTRMARWVAVTILIFLIFIVLAGIITILLPPVVEEGQSLIRVIITAIGRYAPGIKDQLLDVTDFGTFSQSFARLGEKIYSTTIGAFGVVVAAVTTVVLTFYLLLEQHRAREYLKEHLPLEQKDAIISALHKIGEKMGAWVRGQLMLALIIGFITFIALTIMQLIFGLPYALTLGVWAGLTEIIPYIGPILGAIPAVLVALNISPLVALIVLLIYVVIQQLESHILVPKVMQKAVGLSPVTIIIVLLIGGKLAGLAGVILAVPAAAAISVILHDWPQFKKVFSR